MRRDAFQAIADPTRRDIISLIATGSLTLNGVAEAFDVSRQAISKHIRILTDCGILVIRQQGRERYCSVQPEKLNEVHDWMENFRKLWGHRFNKLGDLLTKLQNNKNTNHE